MNNLSKWDYFILLDYDSKRRFAGDCCFESQNAWDLLYRAIQSGTPHDCRQSLHGAAINHIQMRLKEDTWNALRAIAICVSVASLFLMMFNPPVTVRAGKGGRVQRDFHIYRLDAENDADTPLYDMQAPTYIPEGFELVADIQKDTERAMRFSDGERNIVIQYFEKLDSDQIVFFDDNENIENIILYNIFDAQYTVNNEGQQVIYLDTGIIQYIMTASHDIEYDDLIEMFESMLK